MSQSGQVTTVWPPKTCEACGTAFYKRSTYSLKQWEQKRFCSNGCRGRADRASVRIDGDGRAKVWDGDRLRWRSHVVAESALGRSLRNGEVVHHINGNPADDVPENLQIFPSHAEHMRHHGRIWGPPGAPRNTEWPA